MNLDDIFFSAMPWQVEACENCGGKVQAGEAYEDGGLIFCSPACAVEYWDAEQTD